MKILSALLVGSLVASTAFLTLGCSAGEAQPQQAVAAGGGRGGGQQAAVPVTTATVVQKAMPVEITVIGTTEPYSTVAVHSQITGELTSVNFKEGDDVKKGQVLFTLDRRPLEAAVDQAQANLAKDQAQATNARAQAARYQDLLKRGIATHEQSDQMISNAAALDATVAADRAALESAKVQLAYATITAPLSGRTGALMVHAGNLVRAADTIPLVVINQVAPIYVSFGVPEAQLPELKRYMARERIGVQAVPPNDQGTPSTGIISFIDNTVDPTTGTIKIKGTFPNQDHRLWPGQFVNVVVRLTTQADAVVVPAAAVQTGQQGSYVFVVKDDKTVDMRTVQVERVANSEAVIKDGLKTGETIVTDGQLLLVPGSRISVKSADTKVVTP
ncbi:MAG TPA: efflux RND transporter periplasmic adaptor subunit [Vicinamibacterales bacterium]|jgi:multidrug efflux system membrane fusion protein|nr:efflux RND transporter periplasmic adaptor subunit [Vicinamibacterales bacterium]